MTHNIPTSLFRKPIPSAPNTQPRPQAYSQKPISNASHTQPRPRSFQHFPTHNQDPDHPTKLIPSAPMLVPQSLPQCKAYSQSLHTIPERPRNNDRNKDPTPCTIQLRMKCFSETETYPKSQACAHLLGVGPPPTSDTSDYLYKMVS